MVLPTAAAMPNHTPRTCNSFPGEILFSGDAGPGTRTSALGVISGILGKLFSPVVRDRGHDNGGDGKYKAQVIGLSGEFAGRGKWFFSGPLLRVVRAGSTELARCYRCRGQRARRYGL